MAQHFCCLEAVKHDNAHIAGRSCRIYPNTTHAAVVPHLRPEPLTYLLTKLGTYAAPRPPLGPPVSPSHPPRPTKIHLLHAPSQPDNMNMTIHTLRAGRRNTGGGGVRGEGAGVGEGVVTARVTGLCASKNVTWHVGTSPSHLNFPQPAFDCD